MQEYASLAPARLAGREGTLCPSRQDPQGHRSRGIAAGGEVCCAFPLSPVPLLLPFPATETAPNASPSFRGLISSLPTRCRAETPSAP